MYDPKIPKGSKLVGKKFRFWTFDLKNLSDSGPNQICPKSERIQILDIDLDIDIKMIKLLGLD